MSPQPITVDVVCGTSSEQATFRFSCSAPVDPQEFVRQVYDAIQDALSTARPQTSAQAGEQTTDPPVLAEAPVEAGSGSSLSSGEPSVVRSRRPKANPPVEKFDPVAARRRAAEAV